MSSIKVFVFEFASCINVELNPGIAVEGFGMFLTMMRDFSRNVISRNVTPANLANLNTTPISFIRPGFTQDIAKEYFSPQDWNAERLDVSDDAEEYSRVFEEWCEKSDRVLLIAPEDDMILYELSRIADRYSSLGSSSDAVRVCSDKWEVYRKLKGKVDMPETSLKPLSCFREIIKPRISCGGQGIRFYDEECEGCEDCKSRKSRKSCEEHEVCEKGKSSKGDYIYQEFIDGISLSVSMIAGDDISIVSVNEQILKNFEYHGAVVPARVKESIKREVIEVGAEVADNLKLRGYCGVDVVYSDRPYVVDVNARLTTPSIAFFAAYGINLGKLILENYEKGYVSFETGKGRTCILTKDSAGERIIRFGKNHLSLQIVK